MPKKKMLILRATSDACDVEVSHIQTIAQMHQMEKPKVADISSRDELKEAISDGNSYDYIYIAAHGDCDGFGDNEGFDMSWEDFAFDLCTTDVLAQNCVLLLACCRGGFKYVAFDMFAGCDKIEYVFGPRWTLRAEDITAGFHTFIYNMESRRLQPNQAAERASNGTGYDFLCYDRVEVEQTAEFIERYAYDPANQIAEVVTELSATGTD